MARPWVEPRRGLDRAVVIRGRRPAIRPTSKILTNPARYAFRAPRVCPAGKARTSSNAEHTEAVEIRAVTGTVRIGGARGRDRPELPHRYLHLGPIPGPVGLSAVISLGRLPGRPTGGRRPLRRPVARSAPRAVAGSIGMERVAGLGSIGSRRTVPRSGACQRIPFPFAPPHGRTQKDILKRAASVLFVPLERLADEWRTAGRRDGPSARRLMRATTPVCPPVGRALMQARPADRSGAGRAFEPDTGGPDGSGPCRPGFRA